MPQGTVKSFDATTKTGTLVDDTLAEFRYDAAAFVSSGLRELRIGQRVRFERDGDAISQLNIVSL
jgi:cold shock CspA family protein